MADLRFRLLGWWGRHWAGVERWWARIWRRLRRRQRQLGAEVRILGAEVRQLGIQLWDKIDDLPIVPSAFKLTPIRTQFYGHGAFMGAAPALLADPKWRRILAFLMPDVFEQMKAAIADGADAPRLIPMLENNPVMAAFGVFRGAGVKRGEEESPHHLSGLEWDLFVDAELLERWARAKGAERERIMERVIDTALIAHATSADTVQEALGICQYHDVRKTEKTGLGGVEMDAWLDLFARALVLARAEERIDSDEECMRHTFSKPWPIERAVEVHREVTGRALLSVIIEIKSLRSTPAFLSDLVRALNARGVHVAAVASFLRDETEGVSATTQTIGGVEHPGPREIQFFHFAGDLQAACDAGERVSTSVLFNGASLLDVVETDGGRPVYSIKLGVVKELEEYREKHRLAVGFYVQEGDCDHAAAAILSDLVHARPETFELGFAWGGLRDEASFAAGDESRVGYGSQRMLEYVGKARQWQTRGRLDDG